MNGIIAKNKQILRPTMTKMNVTVYMKPALHIVTMLRIVSIEKLTSKIMLTAITANNHALDAGRKLNFH